ncbi:MAG: dTDP-4-amino-4,6-dideoxyglucose formyltransferase [Brumimicrobium sp.]
MINLIFKKVLIFSDNAELCSRFIALCDDLNLKLDHFEFAKSPQSDFEIETLPNEKSISIISMKNGWEELVGKFDLIISIHCKQLFPEDLIREVKCINIHPGFNPYNRGWFPQVFSILNGKPVGATVHEIDEQLDHGPIIAQEEIKITKTDTSSSLYNKIIDLEIELLRDCLIPILENNYETRKPIAEGNINYKSDFNELLELDLSKKQTIGETIDLLRALTHEPYKNACFIDEDTGERIYVNVNLSKEADDV